MPVPACLSTRHLVVETAMDLRHQACLSMYVCPFAWLASIGVVTGEQRDGLES